MINNIMFRFTDPWYIGYQILAHLSIIPMIMFATPNHWIIAISLGYLLGLIGSSVIYHKLLTHKSFIAPTWFIYIGSFFAALGGTGPAISWAAIHRAHHSRSDTENDPHSPHIHSTRRLFFQKLYLTGYFKTREEFTVWVPDLMKSKLQLFIFEYYIAINLIFILLIGLIFGWFGIVYIYFIPTILRLHLTVVTTIVNHKWGYQPYDNKDYSTNNIWAWFLILGEAWHNNHHENPANPNFGRKWFEFDPAYWIIKLVEKKG